MNKIYFHRFPNAAGLPLPSRATPGSVGIDLMAAGDHRVAPGDAVIVPTGFAITMPRGTEGQIRPRSGLAAKHGITVLNSPGTIDPDYKGQLMVILINHGRQPYRIHRGDRIAQLVIAPVLKLEPIETDHMPHETVRGLGGLGSTGD